MNRSRIITRLMFLALALGLFLSAVNPAIRSFVVCNAQSITGTKIKVDRVRSSLGNTSIVLHGVRALHPLQPSKNLIAAEKVSLRLDSDALARRQFVVETGLVEGLQLETDRNTSGAPDMKHGSAVVSDLRVKCQALGDQLFGTMDQSLQTDGMDLQAPQLAENLLAGWERNHEQLEHTAQQTQARINALREYLRAAGENPLRNIDEYRTAVGQLDTMHKRTAEIRATVARLDQQVLMDKETLAQSYLHDMAQTDQVESTHQFNTQDMSQYLLAPKVGGQVAAILQWLQWSRRVLPSAGKASMGGQVRGHSVTFSGVPATSGLIRKLVLRGRGDFAGSKVQIEGIVRNLGSSPSPAKPAEVLIRTTGDAQIVVKATLGNADGVPHDKIVLDSPNLALPKQTLGCADFVEVTVSPTRGRLWAKFELHGDDLTGQLVFLQRSVTLTPHVAERCGGDQIAQLLGHSLQTVDTLDTVVDLTGTMDQPRWRLRSDLGGQLSQALIGAYQSQLLAQRQLMVTQAHAQIDNRIAAVEQGLTDKKAALSQHLDDGDSKIDEVKSFIATRVGLNDGVLNETDPVRETFRR